MNQELRMEQERRTTLEQVTRDSAADSARAEDVSVGTASPKRGQNRHSFWAVILLVALLFTGLPKLKLQADDYRLTDNLAITVNGDYDPAIAEKFQDIVQILDGNYYRELSTDEILVALSEGLLEKQDTPWTYYLSAEDFGAIEEAMTGEYSGIGASVMQEGPGKFKLLDPLPDSPAEQAGIKHGDYILSANGVDVSEVATAGELASQVRGEEGTTVEIEIYRPSTQENLSFEVVRATIESVVTEEEMLDDETGFLYIREFTNNLPDQFQTSLTKLVDAGAKDFIFDLRHNPGGDAQALRECLDMLMDSAEICRIEGRSDRRPFLEIWKTHKAKIVPDDARFMILLSRDSASAAELFSGALRDSAGAVIIGEQSYGKGSGTVSFPLDDGSAANITIFRYILPSGYAVEGQGLTPDYPVAMPPEFMQTSVADIPYEDDPFVQAALDVLAGREPEVTESWTEGIFEEDMAEEEDEFPEDIQDNDA